MSATDRDERAIADQFDGDANNVLLLSPPTAARNDGCVDLLTVEPPDDGDVLFITIDESPDERLDEWRTRARVDLPSTIGVVTADDPTRSAAAAGPATDLGARRSVRSVSSPGDLADLGITVDSYLSGWDGDGNRTVVCFHTLTGLLEHADLDRVFRFVHVLAGRVRATDGLAHYHVDPTALDERTVDVLAPLFDAVVEWDGTAWRARNH